MRRPGAAGGAAGTARLARKPSTAKPMAISARFPGRHHAGEQLAAEDGEEGAGLDQAGAAHDLVRARDAAAGSNI